VSIFFSVYNSIGNRVNKASESQTSGQTLPISHRCLTSRPGS